MSEKLNYSIRPATPNDASGLARLVTCGLPGYPFEDVYDPNKLSQNITAGEHRLVAIGTDNQIIATGVLGLSSEPMAEVKRIVVAPDYRQNGLGKMLTETLIINCQNLGKIPYADVRAHQIGMQRAALNGGLIPYSLETGKHVVYNHYSDQGIDLGSARETMVHMSQLQPDTQELISSLQNWPNTLRLKLKNNLQLALNPPAKDTTTAYQALPKARKVKDQINQKIQQVNPTPTKISDDVDCLTVGKNQLIVIKPDASGFITTVDPNLKEVLDISQQIGLQIVTCYSPVDDTSLATAGLEPAMIRPWQPNSQTAPRWEVGWRKTMNNYNQCLHPIALDIQVRNSLLTL